MKTTKLNEILNDLYKIDPTLKDHEKSLLKILDQFMKSEPNVKLDENFALKLRSELTKKINEKTKSPSLKFSNPLNFFNKFSYAFSGAVMMMIITFTFIFFYNQSLNKSNDLAENDFATSELEEGYLAFDSEINNTKDGAFGKINLVSNSPESAKSTSSPRGQGGGVALDTAISEKSMLVPAPETLKKYVFKYEGEEFTLDQDKLTVYKRNISKAENSLASIIQGLQFSLIDLNNFENINLQNINFYEDKKNGYSVGISFEDKSIWIGEYWPLWDQMKPEAPRLQESDVPRDEELIKIANDFLKQYRINTSMYSEPYVNREIYRVIPLDTDIYIPDSIPVVYPLVIDGKTVHDESGNRIGLNVNVNIRTKKVSNVWNLREESYDASLYEAVTDKNKVLDFAGKGGLYFYTPTEAKEVVEVKISTPETKLIKMWVPSDDGKGQELLIPALVFPVSDMPQEEYFYKKTVIVPLIEEVLENSENQGGPITIMEKR
ncbi:hypothetical protein A2483_05125 [Candidatus Peregrinibacteria bacterium RIFOXYC2_FULL_33_13]|nr:MAG: hypothetical protein UR27_C0015G0041 [Candidatus Peregrinibacteria bacterium GW2011_GWA2_33_10]KKP39543.1 MAG: hypothetical protein UR30_C0010G0039 [Candidatus Peregrinibacteria bacterium GW2011_GWC2_33_13]OGJ48891.1 MAG: hypothetical protein A2229_00510 [Candidatus Peregrinibacteria bacterium RIFOXYA2_FULL_33_7]OGJ55270.1 MAG: hypothetical protein A2483_05125 [Candidatus Peregrinibacteria bacterium RIFOXYC2_FULL_33_13]